MAQVTHGIRSILSIPSIYDLMQDLAGATRNRRIFCSQYLRASSGDVVLDIGCGTGAILGFLPGGVDYHGFDLSEQYIALARERYGERATFHCRDVNDAVASDMPPCDLAMACGLLHHLDDDEAMRLMGSIHRWLKPGGRLLTIDGCFHPDQGAIARWFLRSDRGRNVRTAEQYLALARPAFGEAVTVHVRHDLNHIPYTHAILECRK